MNSIPSPLTYLNRIPDTRKQNNSYTWETLFLMTFLAIGAGSKNILAISQWIQDQQHWLFEQGLTSKTGRNAVPKQASIYRFFWTLETQINDLEKCFSEWAIASLKNLNPKARISLNTDGKHLKGSKRTLKGERAVLLVSTYLEQLGLTLCQQRADGDEAKTAMQLLMNFNQQIKDIPWCLTGDAALTEKPIVQQVLKQKGGITSPSKATKPHSRRSSSS